VEGMERLGHIANGAGMASEGEREKGPGFDKGGTKGYRERKGEEETERRKSEGEEGVTGKRQRNPIWVNETRGKTRALSEQGLESGKSRG